MTDRLLGSKIAGGNTAYGRIKADFYPTPAEATQALLDFLHIPKTCKIWEPACGEGHMVQTLRNNGYDVIGTDINQGQDYLEINKPDGVDWIITNPPFSHAVEFISKSIDHGLPFAFILKAQFWNARKRYPIFNKQPPTWILPLTWRPDFLFKTRGKGAPLMDVMWCVWFPDNTDTRFKPLLKPFIE